MKKIALIFFCVCSVVVYAQKLTVFSDNESGKYGLKGRFEKIVVPAKYSAISETDDYFFATVYFSGDIQKTCLLDKNGRMIIPPHYDFISPENGFILVNNGGAQPYDENSIRGGLYGLFDKNGMELLPVKYEQIKIIDENNFLVNSGGTWQTVFEYEPYDGDEMYQFPIGEIFSGGKWGIVNSRNEVVLPLQYDSIVEFSRDLLTVVENKQTKTIDFKGNTILTDIVGTKLNFGKLIAVQKVVYDNLLWGFYDKKGTEIVAPKYTEVTYMLENLVAVQDGELWGFLDQNGKQLIAPKYSWIETFVSDIPAIAVTDRGSREAWENEAFNNFDWYWDLNYNIRGGGKWGLVDANGKETVEPQYDYINMYPFSKDWIQVGTELDGGGFDWKYVSHDGSSPLEKYNCDYFLSKNDDMYNTETADWLWNFGKITKGNYVGIINKKGKIILPPTFDNVDMHPISDHLFFATKDNLTGIFDTLGNPISPMKYSKYEHYALFKDTSYAVMSVWKDQSKSFEYCVIDTSGKEIFTSVDCPIKRIDDYRFIISDKGEEVLMERMKQGELWQHTVTDYGKQGLFNRAEQAVIESKYDEIIPFGDYIMLLTKDSLFITVEDDYGKIRHSRKNEYDKITPFKGRFALVVKNKREGIFDVVRGKEIIPCEYEDVAFIGGGFLVSNMDENTSIISKFGFYDHLGTQLLQPIYSDIQKVKHGFIVAQQHGVETYGLTPANQYGVLDNLGMPLIPIQYSEIQAVDNGFIVIQDTILLFPVFPDDPEKDQWNVINKRKGFYDLNGKEILPPKYADIHVFDNGFLLAKKQITYSEELKKPQIDWQFSVVDTNLQMLIPWSDNSIRPVENGFIMAKENTKRDDEDMYNSLTWNYEFYNKSGKTNGKTYNEIGEFHNGFAPVLQRKYQEVIITDSTQLYLDITNYTTFNTIDKWGYIDANGNEIVAPKYDEIELFDDFYQLARVKVGEKYGLVNETGVIALPIYDYIGEFSDGTAKIQLNGKWGLIEYSGRIIVEPKYEYVGYFSYDNEPCIFKENGKYGYMRWTSKRSKKSKEYEITVTSEIINKKIMYDYAEDFQDGKGKVRLNGEEFYIDLKGKRIKE